MSVWFEETGKHQNFCALQGAGVLEQGHGVANDHAAFDHGDQARLPKFLRLMNISLHR